MRINAASASLVNPRSAVAVVTGHFGELVQGRLGPDGALALVTLPAPLSTRAVFMPAAGPLIVSPDRSKLRRAARLAIPPGRGGVLRVLGGPPRGGGAGSSTMDVLSAVRAIDAAFGVRRDRAAEARLCLLAEAASDPLMWPAPGRIVWASREARVIERLPPPPAMTVVGGFDGQGMATPRGIDGFADARAWIVMLREGFARRDLSLVGRAATASAMANQAFNPKPRWADVLSLSREVCAAGVAVAHTGSAIALLFPPDGGRGVAAALRALGLTGVRRFDVQPSAPSQRPQTPAWP